MTCENCICHEDPMGVCQITRERLNKRSLMKRVYLDFEYIEETDRTNQLTIAAAMAVEVDGNITNTFYNLVKEGNDRFLNDFMKLGDCTILGYNLVAEVTSLLRLGVSIEHLRTIKWIDLWTESKMFMLTHPDYYTSDTSLKGGAVKVFELSYLYDMNKDPIEIILRGKGNYTDDEWRQIEQYSLADTHVLIPLFRKLNSLWKKYGITPKEIFLRGDFVLESAYQYVKSNGFPMDVELIKDVFNNREEIKYLISKECNEKTGFEIYRAKVKKRPKELSFNLQAFEDFLKANNMYDSWEKTDNKKVSTKEDVFEKFMQVDETIARYEGTAIDYIYDARNTIKQLNSTDLSTLLTKDGYIRTPPFPFNQKSGRSSPKPKLGFILNLVPWIRNTILPKPGKAFISADWSQQEIGLAGYFSQDKKLLESYETDHYLVNAIATGYAPQGATKKTHPNERNLMKAPSLGIIYGMGLKSMAFRVETAMGWSNDKEKVDLDMWKVKDGEFEKSIKQVSKRAFDVASNFIDGHKNYYRRYWDYVEEHHAQSIRKGYYKVPVTGWMYFVEENHSPMQLQNIPNQAGGAAVMQLAYIHASRNGLTIVCPLHDALYVECDEKDIEETKKKLLHFMAEGVRMFTDGKLTIRNEVKVFTNSEPYNDPRGDEMLGKVKQLIKDTKK